MVPINVCPGSGGDHVGHSIIVARTAGYAKTYSRPGHAASEFKFVQVWKITLGATRAMRYRDPSM